MRNRERAVVVMVLFITVGFSGCTEDDGEGQVGADYRQRMRDLVIAISEYSRLRDSDFILVPQNGHDLLSLDNETIGPPAMDYINAIDGMGQEDLLYGYDGDDEETPVGETEWLCGLLDLGEENGLEALVTDYCWTQSSMDRSYEENEGRGYISFAADHRDLDDIPEYPAEPYNVNDDDVTSLSGARNFLYLLDPSAFGTRGDYLGALRDTDYDILIIDAFFDDESILTSEEVSSLKVKANGGRRLVIAYMSIGEAEDYRYYWKDDWGVGNPGFIDDENPDWEGNYKVRYWEEGWQNVLFGGPDSYLDRIISSGFDGVYLDIIEAFEYYE